MDGSGSQKKSSCDDGTSSDNDLDEKQQSGSKTHALTEELGARAKSEKQSINFPSLIQHDGFQFPGVPPSPPQFISLDKIMEAAAGVSKMALAHEIAVNKEFVLEKVEPESGIEKQVKEVVHKAFWDAFEAQLKESPPDYAHALVLLQDIKQALLEVLMPHHMRLRNQIDDIIDLDLIKQQIENNALDIHYYAKFIISTMSRLCAPVRDEKIQELMSLKEVVPLFKGILETLELMKLDMANFAIQQIRPHILQHSVEYERKKFQEFLEALAALTPPVDGLELTRQWFHKVVNEMIESNKSIQATSLSWFADLPNKNIVTKAFLEILQWNNDSAFPETLQMDQVRFLSLRDQLTTVIVISSLLLVTYSIVGEPIQGVASLKQQLKDQLFILLKDAHDMKICEESRETFETVALQIVKEVNQCIRKLGYQEMDQNKKDILIGQLIQIRFTDHSVRKLIKNRIMEFMEQVLRSTDAGSVKFPPGLSAFHVELSRLAGQFLSLVNHNCAVFGNYYSDIISQIRMQKTHT